MVDSSHHVDYTTNDEDSSDEEASLVVSTTAKSICQTTSQPLSQPASQSLSQNSQIELQMTDNALNQLRPCICSHCGCRNSRSSDLNIDQFSFTDSHLQSTLGESSPTGILVKLYATPLYILICRRAAYLATLLLLQSGSSFILEAFHSMLERHVVVTFFLTMLAGSGGNSGGCVDDG